jgi:hypothetical protein
MNREIFNQFECENCLKLSSSKSTKSKFCSVECSKEYKVKHGKKLGEDYVICKICNRATANVTGQHLKNHPSWTPEKYREEFPDSRVIAEKILEKIRKGSVKAGSRMREPEHRKRLREIFLGSNNPMHTSNSSEEKRRSISPFSPDFYLNKDKNLTLEEAQILAKKKLEKNKILSWTQKDYWIGKGYSEEESIKIISNKQSTFSLKKCIDKYGEDDGKVVWKKRQEKWAKSFKKMNYSKNSQKLFYHLHSILSDKFVDIYFATLNEKKEIVDSGKNHEYRLVLEDRVIMPDFFVLDLKKIIEFDGVYWHDYKRRNKRENEKRELEKDALLKKEGFQILRISELEWEKNPSETIKKCLEFLSSNEKNT